ncbi:SCO2523 family variant P-loop protein [Actinoplanes sp. N902-109]|uniref:SCO2523 family variant P-loop protein n=1 Tax=Actinoplanes sp. (strain N902-109) TaxID=649831 RepID=UPI000329657A|nr:SCO2523 family variant P-loop protein [Actinoplanes sp. N902-109]AGL18316.1 nucleotide-binding protein [Actinoplanes sp. N902-109]
MLLFATSDKGGTGRSVTSSNLAYRAALTGSDCCYLDFDFGSPTAGAIFDLPDATAGVSSDGLHSFFLGRSDIPRRIDVWTESEREVLRARPAGAGRLTLLPGDKGGSEFQATPAMVDRCVDLFQRIDEEFELAVVDLSAGRSYATDIVLAATARAELATVATRWLVFHRWTRQHIVAAAGLLSGEQGILDAGQRRGHDRAALQKKVRFIRTAVLDPAAGGQAGLRPQQLAWLDRCDRRLHELASRHGVGRSVVLGEIPLDPVLQWQEQVLSNEDVLLHGTANQETVTAFEQLAKKIFDDDAWLGL